MVTAVVLLLQEDGKVIGIASLVAVQQGEQKIGFSYLRPSHIAAEVLKENGVENKQGLTDEHYRKALDYYWNKHYKAAVSEFETALRFYPQLIDAQNYITKAQHKKPLAEEKMSLFLLKRRSTWVNILFIS